MKANIVKHNFKIKKNGKSLNLKAFEVIHGMIKANGFLFNKVAYISDCNNIPKKSLKNLYNLNFLVLDCLRRNKHPSHFNYDEALKLIKTVGTKKAILTNLHTDLDYFYLKRNLPKNIMPAYDGLSFKF